MSHLEDRYWAGGDGPRRARQQGDYRPYVPDVLHDRIFTVATDNGVLLSRCEAALHTFVAEGQHDGVEALAPLLLSSEAAASSWIEGVAPGARQIALAGLSLTEDVRGFSESARLVANNVATLRYAVSHLSQVDRVEIEDVIELQRHLLPDRPAVHGLRTTQNWIGGSSYNPLSAQYVPPPPEHVYRLMLDLVDCINDSSLSPLIQAAVVHAQFENIHPFADGNGRVGRALIHLVLRRRGVTPEALVPISLVLMTRNAEYVAGLEAFRHLGSANGAEGQRAFNSWLDVFLRAVVDGVTQANRLVNEVAVIRAAWRERLLSLREGAGIRAQPRTGSAVAILMDGLLEAPVMSTETANRLYGLGARAATSAFSQLREAGIVSFKRDRGRVLIVADEIVDFLDLASRRLASPAFDTRAAPPLRPAPAVPRGHSHAPDTDPSFSDAAMAIWAKTNSKDGTWMRLPRHLLDSAATAGELWDHWLPTSVREHISEAFPGGEADGRIAVTFLAGVHDVGKASPGFAVKARMAPGFGDLVDRMENAGLPCPHFTPGGFIRLPPHCRIGHHLLSRWLVEHHGFTRGAADGLAIPVGMHHGVPPTGHDLNALDRDRSWTGTDHEMWRRVQQELLNTMALHTGAAPRLSAWSGTAISASQQALINAVVVVADWLASDEIRFPYHTHQSAAERARAAGLARDLLAPWRPREPQNDADSLLAERFPSIRGRARALQRALVHTAATVEEASLMILEAPMGSGKTEAALMAAEVLASRFGQGGVFVALPTMATTDAMFDRLLQWIRQLDSTERSSIYLAHGKAHLNESYQGLVPGARVRGVNSGEREFGEIDDPEETALVSAWLTGRRKGVLARMVAGTVDQALFGALKARHVALRHLALAGKVVVIDEVHAADDYMRHYLGGVLQWLGAYRTPVILLSATLPPGQRDYLMRAYAAGRGVRPAPAVASGYPQITVQGATTAMTSVEWDGIERHLAVTPLDSEDLIGRLTPHIADGAVITVIRNTVSSAQETYQQLQSAFGDRVVLLHSRFLADARAARESELRHLLGPPTRGVARPQGFVVVGTQVLEQSLDIDADVMVSDLAPVDLLLQRAGRLHRHQRGPGEIHRPASCRSPHLYVLGVPDMESSAPALHTGSRAVYGASRLLRSAQVLARHLAGEPIRLPADIPRLVAEAYAPALSPPAPWAQVWEEAERAQSAASADQIARAQVYRIGDPRAETLLGWLEGRTDASSDREESGGAAQVRDSEDGLEVIVVQRVGGTVRLLPFSGPHPGADLGIVSLAPPGDALALAACGATLRLPAAMTRPGRIDRTIRDLENQCRDFTGWQQSRWLAKQLVLCLDEAFTASIAGWRLQYEPHLGLITHDERDDR